MTKITRFADIPQFTQVGHWECNFDLEGVLAFIAGRGEDRCPDMDPDFQRGRVWTEGQQVAWIEFWLQGGKTGNTIYFNHPGWQRSYKGDFVIVDGKQRCEAIRRFVGGEIKAFGSFYHEYTDKIRGINHTIRINVNDLKTRAEVLMWYLQSNSGGTPHSRKELLRVQGLLRDEIRKGRET